MRPLLTSATLLLVLVTGAGRETQASAIYWTETNGGTISGANADGTGRQTFVTGLEQPVGIAHIGTSAETMIQSHVYKKTLYTSIRPTGLK